MKIDKMSDNSTDQNDSWIIHASIKHMSSNVESTGRDVRYSSQLTSWI